MIPTGPVTKNVMRPSMDWEIEDSPAGVLVRLSERHSSRVTTFGLGLSLSDIRANFHEALAAIVALGRHTGYSVVLEIGRALGIPIWMLMHPDLRDAHFSRSRHSVEEDRRHVRYWTECPCGLNAEMFVTEHAASMGDVLPHVLNMLQHSLAKSHQEAFTFDEMAALSTPEESGLLSLRDREVFLSPGAEASAMMATNPYPWFVADLSQKLHVLRHWPDDATLVWNWWTMSGELISPNQLAQFLPINVTYLR